MQTKKPQVQTSGPPPITPPKTPKSATPEDLVHRFKDYAAIDLISRQLENPGDPGSLAILLVDDPQDACVNSDHQWRLKPATKLCHLCQRPVRKWSVHFINTGIENRWSNVKNRGYVPVTLAEIRDLNDIATLAIGTADQYVRRGDTGKEVLMKRPLELHIAIKRKEHEKLNGTMQSKAKLRAALAESAGAALGDEAGSFVHEGGIQLESISRSKSTMADEMREMETDAIDV